MTVSESPKKATSRKTTAKRSTAVKKAAVKKVPEFEPRVIHMLEDGFTYRGKVWYRGEELWFNTQEEWDDTWRPAWGVHFPEMNRVQQVKRWQKQFFDQGPWPYERLEAMTEEEYLAGLTEQQRVAINRYNRAETESDESTTDKPPSLSGKR